MDRPFTGNPTIGGVVAAQQMGPAEMSKWVNFDHFDSFARCLLFLQ
jgi:hypothetical protein